MLRIPISRLVLMITFVWSSCSNTFADRIIMSNGTQYDSVAVTGFSNGPDGAVFMVRLKEAGQNYYADHPIEVEKIRHIKFNNPEESTPPGFRSANIRMQSGDVIQNMSFLSYTLRPTGNGGREIPVFNLIPGQTLPSGSSSLPRDHVNEMMFRHPQNLEEMTTSKAPEALVATPEPEPVPLAESDGFDPEKSIGSQLFGEEEYPMDAIDGDWSSWEDGGDEDYWNDDSSSYYEDSEYFGGVKNRSSEVGFEIFGMAAGFISIIVYFLVSSITGGIYLYVSSRIEGVMDFPLWKSFIAAAALAFFPWLCFSLCVRYIPIFGLWAGLVSLYFVSRAIIMGALEVMEEKATSVLFTFLLVQVSVLFLSLRYL